MSQSALTTQFTFIRRTLDMNLKGVSEEDARRVPARDAHSVNWVLGHMVATRNAIHGLVGLDPALESGVAAEYGRGSSELVDGAGASVADLLAALDRSQEALMRRLGEVDFDEPVPVEKRVFPDLDLGGQLAALAFHEAYHAGQVGLLRRTLGHATAIG